MLATGFAPFPGAPVNPTQWLMDRLASEGWSPAPGRRLETRTLPTTFAAFDTVLEPLLRSLRPSACVAFGLNAKATGFMLETLGRNALDPGRPDAEGAAPPPTCRAGGPPALATGLPLDAVEDALTRAGLPVARSDDAGGYVCNQTLYCLRLSPDAPRVSGFIHVPYTIPQRDRIGARSLPALSEADLLHGAKLLLATVAECADAPSAVGT